MISGSVPAVFTDNRHTIHFHVVQFINDSFAGALYPYIIRPGSQRDPRFDRHPVIRAHSGKEAPLTTWKKESSAPPRTAGSVPGQTFRTDLSKPNAATIRDGSRRIPPWSAPASTATRARAAAPSAAGPPCSSCSMTAKRAGST